MNESVKPVLNTLSMVEVKGRQNMMLLLQATLLVEANNLKDAVLCLEALTVAGKENLDMVLGCIMKLENMIKEQQPEENETVEEAETDV